MTELGVTYPADQAPPEAEPGMAIHSYFDFSAYRGGPGVQRYSAATNDDECLAALRLMPKATVKFYQIPAGEPLFDSAAG